MNTLMIVLMSIIGIALFIMTARIIDVLMRWYFAMNRHIELLSGVKAQMQELKEKEEQPELKAEEKHNGSNGNNGNNGNGTVIDPVPILNRSQTKAAIEKSLAALQSLESRPKIWRPMEIEYDSKRDWFPQEGN